MKAVLAGVVAIAACVAALAWIVPENLVGIPMWFFIFLALVACGWFSWSHPKAPKHPVGWIKYGAGALAVGAAIATIDAFFHGANSGHVSFDLALCVLSGIVAFSGFAHSLTARGENEP